MNGYLRRKTARYIVFKIFNSDNWITTDLPGVPNIDYPAYVGKTHGNTTGTKLSSAVTSGTNLLSGATIISESGYTKDGESSSKLIDGDLSTKWCATSGSVENQAPSSSVTITVL